MSDQKPNKPYLSPSQIDTFLRCGEAWRRRYIEGERIPPGVAMIQGTGVHVGAETNFRQKVETHRDLPVSDIVDASVEGFDAEVKKGVENDGTDIGEARDQVADMASLYAREIAPEYQPVHVEQSVRIELPGAHDMLGVLDMADDRGRVVDLKTSGKTKQQAEADKSGALTFYAAAHRILTGELASEVRLEVLVKNKKPKRQVLTSTRGPEDFQVLANKINAVSAGIQAGIFLPAEPGSWMCSPRFCGYYATCQFVRRGPQTIVDLHISPGEE